MLILWTQAGSLARGMLVIFAGIVYEVDHVNHTTVGTYLELIPVNPTMRRRAVHIQMSRTTVMLVHIPLM